MRHDGHSARRAEVDVMRDPIAVDWSAATLPDAWVDRIDLRSLTGWVAYGRSWIGPRRKVQLPPDLPGGHRLPAYLRQEFHHLPNGVYSKRHADGYARWFDRLMLGRTVAARARLAGELAGAQAALDVGCGTGGLAAAMEAAGIPEVWALEPSPYLLQLASARHPRVRFVQGIVEDTGFPDARFAGVGACFLFHELPPRAADAALDELRRILVPGGRLVIAEPSPLQFHRGEWRTLLRRSGRLGLYFFLVANWMHEPFVQGWHRRDVASWLASHGFRLVGDETGMPIRFLSAVRV
jgi:ubiquinone/menaquinone biosynthesis C-methylase UbiE